MRIDTIIDESVINLLVKNNLPSKFNGKLYFDFGIILDKISNILSINLRKKFFIFYLDLSFSITLSSDKESSWLSFKVDKFIKFSLNFISSYFLDDSAPFFY